MNRYEEIEKIQQKVKMINKDITDRDKEMEELNQQLNEIKEEKKGKNPESFRFKDIQEREDIVSEQLEKLKNERDIRKVEVNKEIDALKMDLEEKIEEKYKEIAEHKDIINNRNEKIKEMIHKLRTGELNKKINERKAKIEKWQNEIEELEKSGVDTNNNELINLKKNLIKNATEKNEQDLKFTRNEIAKNNKEREIIKTLRNEIKVLENEEKFMSFEKISEFEIPLQNVKDLKNNEEKEDILDNNEQNIEDSKIEKTEEVINKTKYSNKAEIINNNSNNKDIDEKDINNTYYKEEYENSEDNESEHKFEVTENVTKDIIMNKEVDIEKILKNKNKMYKDFGMNQIISKAIKSKNILKIFNIKRKLDPTIIYLLQEDMDYTEYYINAINDTKWPMPFEINYDFTNSNPLVRKEMSKYARFVEGRKFVETKGLEDKLITKFIKGAKSLGNKLLNKVKLLNKKEEPQKLNASFEDKKKNFYNEIDAGEEVRKATDEVSKEFDNSNKNNQNKINENENEIE